MFHDHRAPGGVLLNINAVGHYANVLAIRGIASDFEDAVTRSRELAVRSVGNGGIGCASQPSSTRHRRVAGATSHQPARRPSYVPQDADPNRYAADYHSDVFIPSAALAGGDPRCPFAGAKWPNMLLDYLTPDELPPDHYNYALMRGHPVEAGAKYHNPWGPLDVTPEDVIY